MPHLLTHHKILTFLALLLIAVALAFAFAPWKAWLEARLVALLEEKGFPGAQLSVSDVGLHGITLRDVSLGGDAPLTLQQVTLDFSPAELLRGDVQSLSLNGLTWALEQDAQGWKLGGLVAPSSAPDAATTPLALPVTRAELFAIPLERAALTDSQLSLRTPGWQAELPVQIGWQESPTPTLTYDASSLSFSLQGAKLKALTGPAHVEAALDEAKGYWDGRWHIAALQIENDAIPLPPLEADGTLHVFADRIELEGTLKSTSGDYNAAFRMEYFLNDAAASHLTVTSADLPWNAGVLSLKKTRISLAKPLPLSTTVVLRHISLGTLLQSLTGERASATGAVSGSLPLTIKADGALLLNKGLLSADAPGNIAMSPEAIPGDNPQVSLVRDVLQNLHYEVLSIALDSGKGNALSAHLALEGNNPDVYNGRPVKLNVQLDGDVLDFIRQNLTTFNDPTEFLKQQDNHAQ